MLIRFSPNPIEQATGIIRYNWLSIVLFIVLGFAAYIFYHILGWKDVHLSMTPVGILGGALAIFLGFRNNSAYDRWWEARKIWGGIVNYSRSWGMEVVSLVGDDNEEGKAMKKRLMYRHIAWMNALRMQLRKQSDWESLKPYISEQEYQSLLNDKNKATMLVTRQAEDLRKAYDAGMINDFRHIEMLDILKEAYNLQGKCERIKNTVFPFYYTYFTRLFLWLFLVMLPFGLIEEMEWMAIPVSVAVSFVFAILEKSGQITEDPFEDRAADTPMSSLCTTIEIDLRQQLGETDLPEKRPIEKTSWGADFAR